MKACCGYFIAFLMMGLFFSCGNQGGKKKLADGPRRIEILFLGHDSEHHNSATYLPILA